MTADTKDIVTPDALSVAPELLGLPTARPWRRLAAMLVDLLAIGVLAGLPSLVLGLAAAAVLGRLALRRADSRGTATRVLLALAACGVLAVSALLTFSQRGPESFVSVGIGGQDLKLGAADALSLVAETLALGSADTPLERESAARALVAHVTAAEPNPARRMSILESVMNELEDPIARAAVQRELGDVLGSAREAGPDPALVQQYATALAAGDAVAAERLRVQLAASVAAEELAGTRQAARDAEARVQVLEAEVAELERPKGLRGWLIGLADDLGLGFGWAVLYFTVFTAWWRGQTPGKRLFHCRVVRLDGKALTVWGAFNRAGGYAASVATGLLGFAEILWDSNRQALHDRISRTVVLDERGMRPAGLSGSTGIKPGADSDPP